MTQVASHIKSRVVKQHYCSKKKPDIERASTGSRRSSSKTAFQVLVTTIHRRRTHKLHGIMPSRGFALSLESRLCASEADMQGLKGHYSVFCIQMNALCLLFLRRQRAFICRSLPIDSRGKGDCVGGSPWMQNAQRSNSRWRPTHFPLRLWCSGMRWISADCTVSTQNVLLLVDSWPDHSPLSCPTSHVSKMFDQCVHVFTHRFEVLGCVTGYSKGSSHRAHQLCHALPKLVRMYERYVPGDAEMLQRSPWLPVTLSQAVNPRPGLSPRHCTTSDTLWRRGLSNQSQDGSNCAQERLRWLPLRTRSHAESTTLMVQREWSRATSRHYTAS